MLYSQDGKGNDAVVIAKFFLPGSGFTWYVTEAEKQANGDYMFFGLTQKDLAERLGMTTVGLNQLIRGTMPKVETFVKIALTLHRNQ